MLPGLDKLRSCTIGDQRVKVAIVDGPCDLGHPCFAGADLDYLYRPPAECYSCETACEHGTSVASVIFGQPGTQVPGLAPSCSGIIVPLFSGGQSHVELATQDDLAVAIRQACAAGAQIVNVSCGQLCSEPGLSEILEDALRTCEEAGTLVIAAAGNEGERQGHVPAAHRSVLAVGSLAADGSVSDYSNWHSDYAINGLVAPGENIQVAALRGGIALKSGTSFSTALISGVVALLASMQLKLGLSVDVGQIKEALLRGAVGCPSEASPTCARFLRGIVNLENAIERLGLQLAPDVPRGTPVMALHASSVVADDEDGPAPAFAFPSGHWPNRHVAAGGETMTVSLAESEHVNRPSTGIEVGLKPSDCGCGCGGAGAECTCETHSARYVYPIGKIGFDFVNRTHREVQSQIFEANRINLDDRPAVANYLADPANQGVVRATELVWTLEVDEDPLYAIAPVGPLTTQTYERIIEFFRDQEAGNAEYATIPGTIIGKKFLYLAGKEVDVIAPSLDSMANWSIDYLLTVLGDTGAEEEREEAGARRGRRRGQAEANAQPPGPSRDDLRNFFVLLFDKIKNEGRAPADRARNFAVTAVSVLAAFLKDAFIRELQFEEAVVRPSRVRPAGTDRWEVAISFFNPTDQLGTAVREYPMVVDVNYVQPHLVSSGPARSVSSRVRLP